MHAALPTEAFGLLFVTLRDADTDAILHQRACDPEEESFAWKEHRVLVGDGGGGFTSRSAECQFIPRHHGDHVIPYGLAEMDNGEIVLAERTGTAHPIPVLAFSSDGGTHWSDYIEPQVECDAPMMFTYLGGSELTFRSSWARNGSLRFFSHDYGRTWPEVVPISASPESFDIACEGSPLVDHDATGRVTLMGETGSAYRPGEGETERAVEACTSRVTGDAPGPICRNPTLGIGRIPTPAGPKREALVKVRWSGRRTVGLSQRSA